MIWNVEVLPSYKVRLHAADLSGFGCIAWLDVGGGNLLSLSNKENERRNNEAEEYDRQELCDPWPR